MNDDIEKAIKYKKMLLQFDQKLKKGLFLKRLYKVQFLL